MKKVLGSFAFVLAVTTIAVASALTKADAPVGVPTPAQVDVFVCAGSTPDVEVNVTGVDSVGNRVGYVFVQEKCTVHSGRVTSTGYHSSCSHLEWDGNGLILDIDIVQTSAGRLPVSASACLNQ